MYQAIIKAWRAACDSNATAKVVIPTGNVVAGEILLAGPCAAQQTVTVEIQGNLTAVSDPSAFANGAWVLVQKADNVEFTGGGTIDAHGQDVWEYGGGDSHLAVVRIHIFARLQFQE